MRNCRAATASGRSPHCALMLECEHVRRRETRGRALKPIEAPHDQAGRGEEDDRERHLDHDQYPLRAQAPACHAPAALREPAHEIDARRVQRRRQ